MATIGGLSSTGTSEIRGYGGLASGLDRDSLIESMTKGTVTKIENKQKDKQKLQWKQEAIRGITDKLYNFQQSFLSYASSKNLLSSKLFSSSTITALGSNKDKVSVSGSSSLTKSMSITSVEQLAQNAQVNFKSNASDQSLSTGKLGDLGELRDFNVIADSNMTIKYGSKYYVVSLPEGNADYKYDTAEDVAESLKKALATVSIGDGKTLADAISVEQVDGRFTLRNTDTAGNEIMLAGQSNGLLQNLGFVKAGTAINNMSTAERTISANGLTAEHNATITEKKTAAGMLGGKEIYFTYNGETKSVKLPSGEELAAENGKKTLTDSLQKQMDEAFGKGRIEVSYDDEKGLSFRTMVPGTSNTDNSSVLEISAAGRGILGEHGVFKDMSKGDSNRLNLDVDLMDSGLAYFAGMADEDKKLEWDDTLSINGVNIKLKKGDTIKDLMNRINESDAGVKIEYLKEADRFVFTSTQSGSSGQVKIEGKFGEKLFGKEGVDYTIQEGQDAIVNITYSGSSEPVKVVRGSNNFSLNGLNFTVKSTFDSKAENGGDAITFDSSVDSQPAADAVKEMVEAYNEIVKLVNEEVSTKPNRKYKPLTAEEEKDLSESQLEIYNEKAKAGMLFNDSDLRSLADSLRGIVSANAVALGKMGISVSSDYADNGKIIFDETAFKTAMEEDPDSVMKAFTQAAETDANGNTVTQGGLMVRMKEIVDRYASTTGATKGILIERAGSVHAPKSILSNALQKQMDDLDDQVDRLLDKLETEQDRYIKQFTTLETLISQMNSQSSWLSSAFGA